MAKIISKKIRFSTVYGIPTGGERLAKALEKYTTENSCFLIVDDVFTTGNSMEKARKESWNALYPWCCNFCSC